MIYEVAAAVDHIVSLVQKEVGAEALAGFSSILKDELETRCRASWLVADPEHGSASRAVHWQVHSAGEGPDTAILSAISAVLTARRPELGHAQHQQSIVALALQWLPQSFTLWIDPGCIAVRLGTGPGTSTNFFDVNTKSAPRSSSAIDIVWRSSLRPAVNNILFPAITPSRSIPIVRPAAAAAAPTTHQHQRSISSCSSTSSSVPISGLTRSVSLSSTCTVSTEATEYFSTSPARNNKAKMHKEFFSSPSSSSVVDLDETIGNVTARFSGAQLFAQEDDDAGDVTLDAGDRTLLASAPICASTPARGVKSSTTAKPVASVPTKSNYTTHDNGNVGVLGGGVRLGGAASRSFAPPRHRQHSHGHSLNHVPTFYPPVPHMYNVGQYSVPSRNIPLPPQPQPMQMRAPLHHYSSVPHLARVYHEQQHYYPVVPNMVSFALPQASDAEVDSGNGVRRVRSRGRRSRGRGAGRAARRAAAAAALANEQLESADDLDSTDAESMYSRCSTPATSDYLSSCSASPVKPRLAVYHQQHTFLPTLSI